MRHITLIYSLVGVHKYRHTRLARYARNPPSPVCGRVVNQYYWIFLDNTEKINIIKGFGVISVTPDFSVLC